MAKLTLSSLLAGFRATNKLNENFDNIEAAIENTLSRDGTGPNAMLAPLDMNGQQIINLPEPLEDNSAVRKIDLDNAVISGGGGGTGGAVASVNGKTGVVVLNASDVGGVTSVNGQTGAVTVSSGAVASVNGQTGAVTITAAGLGAVTSVNGSSGAVTVTPASINALASSARGTANGVASLDSSGLIPSAQLPTSGSYKGTWNATTNVPTITSGVGLNGDFYKVATAGTTTIDGVSSWAVGDEIRFGTSTWQKIASTSAVSSVAGKTGAVTLVKADVGLGNVDNTSDVDKPVSTAQATAIGLKASTDLSNVTDATFGGKVFTANGATKSRSSNARAADVADANDFHSTGTWGVSATTDTSAITSAISAMGAGRNTLLLPDTTFLVNPANILTIPNNSRILARSHKTVARLGSALNFNQMMSFNNVDTLTIEGLSLDGNTSTFKRVPFICTYTEGSGTLSNIASTTGIIAGMKLIGWQGYRGTVVSVGANSIVVTPIANSTSVPGVAAGWGTVNSKPSTATTCTADALLGFYRSNNVLLQDVSVIDQQAFGISFDCGTHNRWIGGGSKLLIPESTLNSGFVISSNVRAYQQATAGQTVFTFGGLIGTGTGKVYVNNVLQSSGYTATAVSGNTQITFSSGRAAGDLIEFIVVTSGSTEAWASDFTARDLVLEGTAFQLDCDGAVLDNLLVRNAKYGGCGSLALSQHCRDILVIGGTYSGAATRDADDTMAPGIESFAADTSFVGVMFAENGGYGLTVGGKNNKVIGCTFKNNGKTQTGSAGLQMRYSNVTYNPSGTVIEGNRSYDSNTTKLQSYGLGFANDPYTGTIPPTGVTLGLGNDWSGNLTADVLYTSSSNTIPISGSGVALSSTTPLDIGTAAIGTGTTAARSDHVHSHGNQTGGSFHAVATGVANGFMSSTDKNKLDGVATGATNLALSSSTPASVGAQTAGVATTASRSDHIHDHGNQTAGSHHAVVTTSVNGFMSTTDKTKLDAISSGAVLDASQAFAGATIGHGFIGAQGVVIPGAALGDYVLVGCSFPMQNCTISGIVPAGNAVQVIFTNNTGAAVTLAAGTVYVRVLKR